MLFTPLWEDNNKIKWNKAPVCRNTYTLNMPNYRSLQG